MITVTIKHVMALIVALLLTFGVYAMPAFAHDGEDHSNESELTEAERVEKMKALITVLQELIALITKHPEAFNNDATHTHSAVLEISAEEHGGTTHIHVNESGVETGSFFLEGILLTDTDAVIAAVAEKTGRTVEEVSNAILFPSHEDEEEHNDEHEEDEHSDDEDMDLEGIHIMMDGTVMLGNGEELADATITDEGMIMLADGTLVEPGVDLRP
jgi:hypothetical protein